MFARRFLSPKTRWLTFIVYVLLAAACGTMLGLLDTEHDATGLALLSQTNMVPLWIGLGLGILGALCSFLYSLYWMQSIDEAAREAHKWAWYWGGSVGLAVGMVGFVVAMVPATAQWTLPRFLGRTDPVAYAALGAAGLLALLMAGYGLGWVWWWWQRR